MLTGQELLSRVTELKGASKTELVRECGYVSTKKDGSERLNFTAFYEALLQARGVNLDDPGRGKPGRSLSYETRVQFNGNLLIGRSYVAEAGFQPGDVFAIRPSRNGFSLRPVATGDGDQFDGSEAGDCSLPFAGSEAEAELAAA